MDDFRFLSNFDPNAKGSTAVRVFENKDCSSLDAVVIPPFLKRPESRG
jgi:hypothetical protein